MHTIFDFEKKIMFRISHGRDNHKIPYSNSQPRSKLWKAPDKNCVIISIIVKKKIISKRCKKYFYVQSWCTRNRCAMKIISLAVQSVNISAP